MMEEKERCSWCLSSDLYKKYHDEEWGVPVFDDGILFEFLVLESFQAGLSWITILNKRENFRQAFDCFDYQKIALYNESKIENLLQNPGIIRHRLKVVATINNAKAFMKIQAEFGSFANYLWGFVNNTPIVNIPKSMSEVVATTALSDKISKDLKNKGFKFLGSTTVYAYMQAVGMVNDHNVACWKSKIDQNQ
jgi:DNA-3-methyladenine glycosylase I